MIGCEEGTMPHKRVSDARISDAIAGAFLASLSAWTCPKAPA
jgi:hypothetical protein